MENQKIKEYQKLLSTTPIQEIYRGLIDYMRGLQNYLVDKYPKELIGKHFYQGYLDYTYFSLSTEVLKNQKLKIVIGLDYSTMQFEAYLVGQNRKIREKYIQLFLQNNWNEYHVSSEREDAILLYLLDASPDFSDEIKLNKELEKKVMKFIRYINSIL